VRRLDDRVERLQKHFDQTVEDLRQVRISSQKVIDRGERIDELQLAGTAEDEAPVEPVLPAGSPAEAANV
jgi:DNA recombination protein RmuC